MTTTRVSQFSDLRCITDDYTISVFLMGMKSIIQAPRRDTVVAVRYRALRILRVHFPGTSEGISEQVDQGDEQWLRWFIMTRSSFAYEIGRPTSFSRRLRPSKSPRVMFASIFIVRSWPRRRRREASVRRCMTEPFAVNELSSRH